MHSDSKRNAAHEAIEYDKQQLRLAMGEVLACELDNPRTTEVFLLDNCELWAKRLGEGLVMFGRMEPEQSLRFMKQVAGLSNQDGRKVLLTAEDPFLEVRIPYFGFRFAGSIPPVSPVPTFNIRKPPETIFTVEQWLEGGALTQAKLEAIVKAVREEKNILVAGGTGSGKTTFLNALLELVARQTPQSPVVLLQDDPELKCAVHTRREFSVERTRFKRTLEHFLRRSPSRIIVGELRGDEVITFLQLLNTGHPGSMSTLHANDAPGVLPRIEDLLQGAGVIPVPRAIAAAIDLVVYIQEDRSVPAGRRVSQVAWLKRPRGFDHTTQEYLLETVDD